MKVYDMLAGRYGFGKSRLLSKEQVLQHIPTLEQTGLRGGVLYYDGQFDDARLLIDLAQTAHDHGAVLLNYAAVTALSHDADGYISGLCFRDEETGLCHSLSARCVINAAGAFCDGIRQLDDPSAAPIIAASQGVHLVLDRSFLPGDAAIMVPKTSDGRVMFAIPWHDHVLLGTTDTPIDHLSLEPRATDAEIDFILDTAAQYLTRRPNRADVLSVFTGIRPLVKTSDTAATASLSRDHTILVSGSGLITIAGGKWTTYRKMAEDCVDHAATIARLEDRPCITRTLKIHGHEDQPPIDDELRYYGSTAAQLREVMRADATLARQLHSALPIRAVQVIWAARHEMARTLDDVLARRTRALFLNARAAIEMAPDAAALLAFELGRDGEWQSNQVAQFTALARNYLLSP